jgi:hypothetical protein
MFGALLTLVTSAALTTSGCGGSDSGPKPTSQPDIILVVIDALRPDHLSSYGFERDTDLTLVELATDAVVFENAFAAAPKTIPSIPQTLSSSLFPDSRRATTLMETARSAGYAESVAVVNNPYVKKWIERLAPTFADVIAGELSASEIVDAALQWFDRPAAGPRLAYLHFLDTHTPYAVPLPFKTMFIDTTYRGELEFEFSDVPGAIAGRYKGADRTRIVDLYDGTIAYVDAELGRFLSGLEERAIYENALIIVTADHGEEFWDHGSFFHGQSLYDELLRVPLIVKYPAAWQGGTRVARLAWTLDILPTIADMMTASRSGLAADPDWLGRRLSDVIAPPEGLPDRTLFATVGRADQHRPPRHSVRSSSHKAIVNVVDGTRELYELETDPLERRSVIAIGTEPPQDLLGYYAATTAPLAESGYQLELTNSGERMVSYDLQLEAAPPAPFVNLHRIDLENTDTILLESGAAALRWKGRLPGGESDRIRFDLLTHSGALNATLTIDGHLAEAIALRIGSEGTPAETNPASIDISLIDGPPSTASSARAAIRALLPGDQDIPQATLALWRSGDSKVVLPPTLSKEEQARVRALGYIE